MGSCTKRSVTRNRASFHLFVSWQSNLVLPNRYTRINMNSAVFDRIGGEIVSFTLSNIPNWYFLDRSLSWRACASCGSSISCQGKNHPFIGEHSYRCTEYIYVLFYSWKTAGHTCNCTIYLKRFRIKKTATILLCLYLMTYSILHTMQLTIIVGEAVVWVAPLLA